MAFLKVTLLVGVMIAVSSARPQYEAPPVQISSGGYSGGGGGGGGGAGDFSNKPASYSFSYDNSDPEFGNYFGHAEQREGPNSSGEYRVLLPDGRTQIVTYTVEGDGGYLAKVSYEQAQGGSIAIGGGGAGGGGGYQ